MIKQSLAILNYLYIALRLSPRHNLWPDDATILIDQLNRRSLAVVGDAISHQHVKLILVVLDSQHHRHGLADLHDAGHFAGPRTLADLYLHPTLQVVAEKVGCNGVQHVDLERPEGDRLLVEVVPGTTQLSRLIPHFLHVRIVLYDDRILHVAAGRRRGSVSRDIVIRRRTHAARVEEDLEGRAQVTGAGFEVNAMRIRVKALAKDHTVKRPIELDVHPHMCLLALHLQMLDLRSVGRRQRPVLLVNRRRAVLSRGPID